MEARQRDFIRNVLSIDFPGVLKVEITHITTTESLKR
jgi:hypothetical protein